MEVLGLDQVSLLEAKLASKAFSGRAVLAWALEVFVEVFGLVLAFELFEVVGSREAGFEGAEFVVAVESVEVELGLAFEVLAFEALAFVVLVLQESEALERVFAAWELVGLAFAAAASELEALGPGLLALEPPVSHWKKPMNPQPQFFH